MGRSQKVDVASTSNHIVAAGAGLWVLFSAESWNQALRASRFLLRFGLSGVVMTSSNAAFEPFLDPLTGVEEQLRALIEPVCAGAGLDLVVLQLVRGKTNDLLRLSVDRPHAGVTPGKGVTMAELQKLNHLLGDLLDVEDNSSPLFKDRWELEVGSPGVDRPLTKKSHFVDVVGSKVKARLKLERRSLLGTLDAADADGIVVDGVRASFAELDHVHVVYEFQERGKPGGKGNRTGKSTPRSSLSLSPSSSKKKPGRTPPPSGTPSES